MPAMVSNELNGFHLRRLARRGNAAELKDTFDKGLVTRSTLDSTDGGGFTALHRAAHTGRMQCVQVLLANGANVNCLDSEKKNALHRAASKGHAACVELLLRHGGRVSGGTPFYNALHIAACNGHAACVQVLLEFGADVDSATPRFGYTALNEAALKGRIRVVDLLLRNGATVGGCAQNGITPLHRASQFRRPRCVRLLLEGRACADAVDVQGKTPLHYAVTNGAHQCVALLLQHGADPNHPDFFGLRPLHHAVGVGHNMEIVELLCTNGADLDGEDKYNRTALQQAVWKAQLPCIAFLCQEGALVNVRDDQDNTAFECALFMSDSAAVFRQTEFADIMQVLLEFGSDSSRVNFDTPGRSCTTYATAVQRIGRKREFVRSHLEHIACGGMLPLPLVHLLVDFLLPIVT